MRLIRNLRGVTALGALLLIAACGGPALTPLQSQYQREQDRAGRYYARGELPRALQAYQDSLRWAEIADDRAAILTQALNVGAIALTLGEWALAERSFQQAQRNAVAVQDAEGQLQARLGLAQIDLRQGQFAAAKTAFQQTLETARDRSVAATLVALNGFSLACQGLEQRIDAQRALEEAETLARAHSDQRLLAATLANRAVFLLRSGDARQAEKLLDEAIALDRAAENLPGLAQDFMMLAQTREQTGDTLSAQDLDRQARIIARHTGQFLFIKPESRVNNPVEKGSSARLQSRGLE